MLELFTIGYEKAKPDAPNHCAGNDSDRHEGEEDQRAEIAFERRRAKKFGPGEAQSDADGTAQDGPQKQAKAACHCDVHAALRPRIYRRYSRDYWFRCRVPSIYRRKTIL